MSSAQSTAGASQRTSRKPARAEIVGSLLKPREVREAFQRIYYGKRTAASLLGEDHDPAVAELDAIADEQIGRLVQRQIDAGLDVVTDGEMRRALFTNSFYDAIEGVGPNPDTVIFEDGVEYPGPPIVDAPLRKAGSPAAREAAFMASITDHPFKVTFPAGSWFHLPYIWKPGVTDRAYPDQDAMAAAALAIQQELVAEAIAAGARYVQFDFPVYPFLVDDRWLEFAESNGIDPAVLFDKAIAADQAILAGIPDDVTVAMHICRGNYRSRSFVEANLEPVAERVFNELPYDKFLVEWEDVEREGSYEPIKHLPSGRIIAMGVVSTKRPAVESEDELMRRMDEASRYLDLDRLAISPQCGFASAWEGNELGEEAQWRKLETLSRVADRLWPHG